MAPLAVDEKRQARAGAPVSVYMKAGFAQRVRLRGGRDAGRSGVAGPLRLFELAAHYDLHCRWPGTESAFRAQLFIEDALEWA